MSNPAHNLLPITASTSVSNSRRLMPAPALWAHLLQKPGSSHLAQSSASTIVSASTQITPVDKAGISTRILLHDTHARLEAFAERTGKLADGVEQAQRDIVRMREEMEKEMEKIVDDVSQLVNRCQNELKKAMGEPAQERSLSDMRMELTLTNQRLSAVDTKIDSLHTLSRSQSHALQSLQDQQTRAQEQHTQLVALLTPVLPLLQALPLHIDIARNAVINTVNKHIPSSCLCSCSSPTSPSRPVEEGQNIAVSLVDSDKAHSSGSITSVHSMSPRKRRRLNSIITPLANMATNSSNLPSHHPATAPAVSTAIPPIPPSQGVSVSSPPPSAQQITPVLPARQLSNFKSPAPSNAMKTKRPEVGHGRMSHRISLKDITPSNVSIQDSHKMAHLSIIDDLRIFQEQHRPVRTIAVSSGIASALTQTDEAPAPPPPPSLRDRRLRAPTPAFRCRNTAAGKRFIPLDDDDDELDEEGS
ncbi:hypothetical protein EW146_g6503 [Bondarzewia mesenterica]|uniref:Uncharacterized protein n=1 Tax=Bondarzewia mesenterica TaxID=1095465 RepID=A0A4S4LNH9_9AGAM|nr:hypothetical protein EW146_g6503 [Bondarzewia mesenterica]